MTDEHKGPRFTPPLTEEQRAKLTAVKAWKLIKQYKSEISEYQVIVKDQRELIDAYRAKVKNLSGVNLALFMWVIALGLWHFLR